MNDDDYWECATDQDRHELFMRALKLINHLRNLLDDKKYISIKADYNKGHLSYAGQLEAREKEPE